MKSVKALFLTLFFLAGVVSADFDDGLDAYNQGDYDTAFEEWLPYAEQGDASAQYNLALVYEIGYEDYTQAIEWYKKSANQGYDKAQVNLGLMYSRGNGAEVNKYEAVKWYRKSAEQDNPTAQNNLAVMYENGTGVTKSYKQSINWYLKAVDGGSEKARENLNDLLVKLNNDSEPVYSKAVKDYDNKFYEKAFPQFLWLSLKGNVRAQTYIGVMYAKGFWMEKNYQQANDWYKKAADQGYKVAQHNLGINYEFGKGFSKDYKKAVEWYQKAANQGYRSSQYNLADMYRKGEGVVKSEEKAIKWYKKAADQGHLNSQFGLGYLYDTSKSSIQSYSKAVKWYKKAADKNHALAQYNLALLYEYGYGVKIDINQALKWYKKAAAQGDEDAKVKIKKILASQESESVPTLKEARQEYDAKNYYSAFPKFLKLANQGDIEAQVFLGWMYRNGWGTDKNNIEAFKWFDKLSALDNDWAPWAQNQLGIMYFYGDGTTKNIYKAIQLYRKSAESGYELAQYNLALQYERGTGVKKDIDIALKWYKKAAAQGDEDAKVKVEELLALQGEDNNQHTIFSGSGTGFVVSMDGVVATNYHVINDCGRIVIDEKDAKIVLQDKKNDLALIKVDKTYNKVSSLSYRSPELGSDVNVFGYPLSELMSEEHISLTKGSVSSLAGMDGNLSSFRFTAPVQPGNSGGPIVNKEGRVVGVTQAVLGKTVLESKDGFLPQNVNFGIRSSLLINMMESKMIPVKEDRIPEKDLIKHYVKATKYIKCYE